MNNIDRFLLFQPFTRGMVELLVLLFSGIGGLALNWEIISDSFILKIIGWAMLLWGGGFHWSCEKFHRYAHQESEAIFSVVTEGPYAKIRHPLYLGMIVMNMGIAIVFNIQITFLISLLSVLHWSVTAISEEKALKWSLGKKYSNYMKNTRWRFVPGIF